MRLLKDAAPAFGSPWIGLVEGLSIRSHLMFAHIRRASTGEVALRNTHPFMRELGGRPHVFAHNGAVPNIFESDNFPLGQFRPVGNTDSEWAFCSLMAKVAALWRAAEGPPALESITGLVADFAFRLRAEGTANFLYSDGEYAFLHGDRRQHRPDGIADAPGLHILIQHDPEGAPFRGSVGMAVRDVDHPVVVAASVPLTDEEWTPLQEGQLLVVRDGEILAKVNTSDAGNPPIPWSSPATPKPR